MTTAIVVRQSTDVIDGDQHDVVYLDIEGQEIKHRVLKRFVEAQGANWVTVFEKIQQDEVLQGCIRKIRMRLSGDPRIREVVVAPEQYIYGIQFKHVVTVKPELQPKKNAYDAWCYKTLALAINSQSDPGDPRFDALERRVAVLESRQQVNPPSRPGKQYLLPDHSALEAALDQHFRYDGGWSDRLTSTAIIDVLCAADIQFSIQKPRALASDVGRILRRKGLTRVGDGVKRYYVGMKTR